MGMKRQETEELNRTAERKMIGSAIKQQGFIFVFTVDPNDHEVSSDDKD